MQTIKPAPTQLFCKPEEAIERTKSGFLLADSAKEKPKQATVINVGAKVTNFQPNDKIVYKSYSTTDISLDKVDYFIVNEDDVLGTIVETK